MEFEFEDYKFFVYFDTNLFISVYNNEVRFEKFIDHDYKKSSLMDLNNIIINCLTKKQDYNMTITNDEYYMTITLDYKLGTEIIRLPNIKNNKDLIEQNNSLIKTVTKLQRKIESMDNKYDDLCIFANRICDKNDILKEEMRYMNKLILVMSILIIFFIIQTIYIYKYF